MKKWEDRLIRQGLMTVFLFLFKIDLYTTITEEIWTKLDNSSLHHNTHKFSGATL
jgi:hypothetical protein